MLIPLVRVLIPLSSIVLSQGHHAHLESWVMKRIRVETYQIHFYRRGKYEGTLPQCLTASGAVEYVECYNRLRQADGMHARVALQEMFVRPPFESEE